MISRHHLLFNGRAWSAYGEGRSLRETPSLIIPMEHEAHQELHKNIPIVPMLGYYGLASTRKFFEPEYDGRDIDRLQQAIEKSKGHPRSHMLERSLADLAIHAIDLQKPYFK